MTFVATTQAISHCSPSPSTISVSSVSSVWSALSVGSSTATSVASSDVEYSSAPPTAFLPQLSIHSIQGSEVGQRLTLLSSTTNHHDLIQSRPCSIMHNRLSQPLPLEQRQHPRRTNRSANDKAAAEGCVLPPVPTLQRQADRKVNFVENLVDSAAQIVETIWKPPKYLANLQSAAPKDVVLPLRTFIQETLRRSRTSYSTLQVALYYLIVIRPCLPSIEADPNELDLDEGPLVRAKQCGRRMFLAALILASKYLQDRNYSSRAWSKISGLNVQEINFNEMAFLRAVDYKLHISEVVFQKWSDLVLKYTSAPSPSPVSPTRSSSWFDEDERKREWCELVLRLSPDLREVDLAVPLPQSPVSPVDLTQPSLNPINPGQKAKPKFLTRSVSMPQVQLSRGGDATQVPHRLRDAAIPHKNTHHPYGLPISKFNRSELGIHTPTAHSAADGYAPAASRNICAENAEVGLTVMVTPQLDSPTVSFTCNPTRGSFQSHTFEAVNATTSEHGRRSGLSICVHTADQTYIQSSIDDSTTVPIVTTRSKPWPIRPTLLEIPAHSFVMASPKSAEAAWTLKMLQESPSPTTSVGSMTPKSSIRRKRSCPTVPINGHPSSFSSGVTPRLRGLGGLSSPVISSPGVIERGGKRARCGWEMDGMDPLGRGLAQGVR